MMQMWELLDGEGLTDELCQLFDPAYDAPPVSNLHSAYGQKPFSSWRRLQPDQSDLAN